MAETARDVAGVLVEVAEAVREVSALEGGGDCKRGCRGGVEGRGPIAGVLMEVAETTREEAGVLLEVEETAREVAGVLLEVAETAREVECLL